MKGASTIFLQYFPLNMSIVWINSLGEIGAKRSEYEKAAPSQYLLLGSSADEEIWDGAVEKFSFFILTSQIQCHEAGSQNAFPSMINGSALYSNVVQWNYK